MHLDAGRVLFKSPKTIIVSCWKIRFKTQVSACSSFPSEALFGIKEVEMVDSVDDLTSSRQFRIILMSRILRCWMRGLRLL